MEEGRVYTHGTEGCARRSKQAGTAKLKGCQVRVTFRRFWRLLLEGSGTRTARARVQLRVVVARVPPGAPTLTSHGPNVRCKKTYRATQRTNRGGAKCAV